METHPPNDRAHRVVRFGHFEVSFQDGELRKHGLLLKLQDKPLQILLALLERPGELVTREEMREKLWTPDTYVDFERSLNIAMTKLREALADDAENPRYVETVRRKGYRFIGTVKEGNGQMEATPSATTATAPGGRGLLETPGARAETAPPQRRSGLRTVLGAAGLSIFASVGFLYLLRPLPPPQVLDSVQISKDGTAKGTELLTDGLRLYFRELSGSDYSLVEMSTAGGEPFPLHSIPAEMNPLDLCPTRPELLVRSPAPTGEEQALWVYPLPLGSPRRLGNLAGHAGCWSPDGERILFANGNGLYVADRDGSAGHKVLSVPGRANHLIWSPDGKLLRFLLADENLKTFFLWESRVDGSHLRRLYPLAFSMEAESRGTWTPDGRYFIFSSTQNGRTDLWAVREKSGLFPLGGGEPVRLTAGQVGLTSPVAGRDGKTIFALGKLPRIEVVRYDRKAGEFLPHLTGVSADGLAFTPDAEWVAYTSYPDRTLWRCRADGSARLQLTFSPQVALLPSWSPDGQRIAYMAKSPQKPWKIYMIPAAGGAPEQLVSGEGEEANATWSPDGSSIIFAGLPWTKNFAAESTAIRRIDLRSRQVTTLPESQGLWSPRWSPDGRYLVAESTDSRKLMLFDFAAQHWEKLAGIEKGDVGYTSWSRDSRFVWFNTFTAENEGAIYRVDVARPQTELVVSLKGFRPAQTLGSWFALAPDDSPLMARDSSVQEVYSLAMRLP